MYAALADALARVASGNLAARITDFFPEEYRQLKDDFNAAIESLEQVMLVIARDTTHAALLKTLIESDKFYPK